MTRMAGVAGRDEQGRPGPTVTLPGWRDVTAGLAGAGIMAAAVATPFLRRRRAAWGVGAAEAGGSFPGDELVPVPRWSWTHGIDVRAPAAAAWPWIAQIGADRAGFYSYQWLENLVGCHLRNAERVHPEWAHQTGGELSLHPKAPPLHIVSVQAGQSLLAYMPRTDTLAEGSTPVPGTGEQTGWMTASWLFLVRPLGSAGCRVISRYRCATSDDLASRLRFGPGLIEPVGFAMDRRMLIGIRQRAERSG